MLYILRLFIILSAVGIFVTTSLWAQGHQGHDMSMEGHHMGGNAPIGVTGGHTHHANKWMATYKYMYMDMHGNREGTDRVSTNDVRKGFLVSPIKMTMQMHMLGIMYGISDDLSVMVMVPYLFKEMDHITRMQVKFTTRTEGIGDVKYSVLYGIYKRESIQFILNAGVSFPTGSIDEEGHTPLGRNVPLPYPMQLGSGTFDLLPGITYLGNRGDWSWGMQVNSTFRLGKNNNEYALGDTYGLNTWVAKKWVKWLSTSIRIEGQKWENIEGADPGIAIVNPMGVAIVPTADPGFRGGERLDLLFGLDIASLEGILRGGRIAVEGGFPVYQHLDGPQLETDWLLTAGLQWSF